MYISRLQINEGRASCELSEVAIYYHQIIGMHIQDTIHEILKHCGKFRTFCLQAEVNTGYGFI